jgi:hypothetical protein
MVARCFGRCNAVGGLPFRLRLYPSRPRHQCPNEANIRSRGERMLAASPAAAARPGGWPTLVETRGKQRTAEQRCRNDDYIAKFDNIFLSN